MQPTQKKLADTQVLSYNPGAGVSPQAPPAAGHQRKLQEDLGKASGVVAGASQASLTASPGAMPPLPVGAGSRSLQPARSPRAVACQGVASVLNQHLTFEGNLKFTGTVTIDCEFRGSILTDDTLVVGIAGRVDAEVSAGIIEISGKVHGNLRAKTRVRILSGGEIYGNIETPTISMDEGVIFEGNCSRPPCQGSRPVEPQAEPEKAVRQGEAVASTVR